MLHDSLLKLLRVSDEWTPLDRAHTLINIVRRLTQHVDPKRQPALRASLRIVTGEEHDLGPDYARKVAAWSSETSLDQRLTDCGIGWLAKHPKQVSNSPLDTARKQWYGGRIDLSRLLKDEIDRKNRLQDWERPFRSVPAATLPASAEPNGRATPTTIERTATVDGTEPLQFPRQARDIPLSGLVQEALDAARASCAAKGRRYYTTDSLHALIELPDGDVAACFDEVKPGLAGRVQAWVAQSASILTSIPPARFKPFVWVERPEVQRAQDLVLFDGSAAVTDVHLLLAILEGSSTTREELEELLGTNFDRLHEVANRRRYESVNILKTPKSKHDFS